MWQMKMVFWFFKVAIVYTDILKSQNNKERKGVRVLWIQRKAKIIMSAYGLWHVF